MIYKFLILITFLVPLPDSFRSGMSFSKPVEKRIHKALNHHFHKEDYSKLEIKVHDSILDRSNSYFYRVENNSKTDSAIMVITIANGCRIGGCDVEHKITEEFERFYIYSLFDGNGSLLELKIIDYQAEHGYQVTSKWWLKQFIKHQEEKYEYSKNIDAVSGATISVKSMIREMTYLKACMPAVISQSAN